MGTGTRAVDICRRSEGGAHHGRHHQNGGRRHKNRNIDGR
jgi:hypothetical protein